MVRPLSSVPGFIDPSKVHARFQQEPQDATPDVSNAAALDPVVTDAVVIKPEETPEVKEEKTSGSPPDPVEETRVIPETEVKMPDAPQQIVYEGPTGSVLGDTVSQPEEEIEDLPDYLELSPSGRPPGRPSGSGSTRPYKSVIRQILSEPSGPSPSRTGLPASFSAAVDKHEGAGNYDTLFGHAQRRGRFAGTKVSEMTVGEAIRFSSPSGAYAQSVKRQIGRVATPMGRYQIVGTTLRNAARAMGLSMDTPFNAETQDRIAAHLAKQRIRSVSSESGKIAALRAEWEGFKNVPTSQMAQIVRDLSRS